MMKKLILTLALLLTACGTENNDPAPRGTARFGSKDVTILNGNLGTGDRLEGSGSALFPEDFGSTTTAQSFALDFSLAENSRLTLVSHGDSNLVNGWEMEFRRQGTGQGSLKVTLHAHGVFRDTLDSARNEVFGGMDASQPLKLQIDLHNDENPAHALVWSRAIADNFHRDLVIFNSSQNRNSPGVGLGSRWGLVLVNARVTRAEVSGPKLDD